MYQNRVYRSLHKRRDLVYFTAMVEQTDLHIGATRILKKESLEKIRFYRSQIEGYIKEDPRFLVSLEPLAYRADAPDIVRWMCEAASKAGVGPMAAVAGAISQKVGEALLPLSSEVIVENGGDIFIKTNEERVIAIHAGASPLNQRLGLRILPQDTPCGICTSAGKVGHSLSLGKADAAVVLSRDTALADAVATALGNRVKTPGDIEGALGFAQGIDGIMGALVIIDDRMGAWGQLRLEPIRT